MIFFFFSSRRRHTRWNCDWSSDVCSSDLRRERLRVDRADEADDRLVGVPGEARVRGVGRRRRDGVERDGRSGGVDRSEERRVGKECRSWGWTEPYKKNRKRSQAHYKERQT